MTDNELIAEFMGHSTYAFADSKTYFQDPVKREMFGDPMLERLSIKLDLKYHDSWDWLMPVVEKIAKIETKDTVRNGEDSYFDSYFPRTFGMINSETKAFMVRINRNPLHQSDSLIKATHEAVVEFIKWYNQNK